MICRTFIEKILIDWEVISNSVSSFPSTEERESWSQLELYRIVLLGLGRHAKIRGRDVADLVSVVNARRAGWQEHLEGLHRRGAALTTHVLEARERADELGTSVKNVHGFFDRDVAPVRDFDESVELFDCQECCVVLGVNA